MNPATLQTIVVALLTALGAVGGQVIRASGKVGRDLRAARSLSTALGDYIYQCRRLLSAHDIPIPEYPAKVATYLDPGDDEGT